MGQRSQIYVRYYKDGKWYLTARYYQWNYGERMISRCRYTLEWIKEYMKYDWHLTTDTKKLTHIMDTNFDMKDVILGYDIVEEWKEYCPENNFNDVVFRWQDNNDGQLYIEIKDEIIKYAFLEYSDCNTNRILSAAKYMNWDSKGWRQSPYIDDEQKLLCEENLKEINKLATLLTKEELDDFINYDYID